MNNLENIKQAISLQKELDKLRPLSDEQNQKVLQKFRLDWNYHSNNIEGNSLTYGETKLLLLHRSRNQYTQRINCSKNQGISREKVKQIS